MNQEQNRLFLLSDYHDIVKLQSSLFVEGKLSESVLRDKAGLIRSCAATLLGRDIDPQAAGYGFYVPGRIEVLGKHTDYAGGRSILAAVEKGFCFVATVREDEVLDITDVGRGERISFSMYPELTPALGHWSNYPQTVARRVSRNFTGPLRGCDVAFISEHAAQYDVSVFKQKMAQFVDEKMAKEKRPFLTN